MLNSKNKVMEAIDDGWGDSKTCVSCGLLGHTYVVCPNGNIFELMMSELAAASPSKDNTTNTGSK